MKVKVIKSRTPFFWYNEYIGWEFSVKSYSDMDYIVMDDNEEFDGCFIEKKDCEEVIQ